MGRLVPAEAPRLFVQSGASLPGPPLPIARHIPLEGRREVLRHHGGRQVGHNRPHAGGLLKGVRKKPMGIVS